MHDYSDVIKRLVRSICQRQQARGVWLTVSLFLVLGTVISGAGWRSTLMATEPSDLTLDLVGQFGGSPQAIYVEGSHAYLGVGLRVVVLDVSDPQLPHFCGQTQETLPDLTRGIYKAGDHLYVANDTGGLWVFSVSQPCTPTQVGAASTMGRALDVYVTGDRTEDTADDYAYVAADEAGLLVFSVADPAQPVQVGQVAMPGKAVSVVVDRQYAYVAASSAGLRVLSLAYAAQPVEVGAVAIPGAAVDVRVSGYRVYVTAGNGGLRVIDVFKPDEPMEIGHLATPGDALGIDVVRGYAYVAASGAGLRIISLADPKRPIELGALATNAEATAVAVSDGNAYVVARDHKLRVVNVVNPAQPTEIGNYSTPGRALDVSVDETESYAYVAAGSAGLRILSLATDDPQEVGKLETPGTARRVQVAGDYAYLAAGSAGLRIISIANPGHRVEVGYHLTPGDAVGVFVEDTYAYVVSTLNDGTGSFGVLTVLSVADPAHPVRLSTVMEPGTAQDVFVADKYAYLAAGPAGLRIILVSNPAHPVTVNTIVTSGNAWGVFVAGEYAYVAAGQAGLRVLSLADPANPVEVGKVEGLPDALAVRVVGERAHVASGQGGLALISVRDPLHPEIQGVYATPADALSVYVTSSYEYVASSEAGLLVLKAPQVPRVVITSPAPNSSVDTCVVDLAGTITSDAPLISTQVEVNAGSQSNTFDLNVSGTIPNFAFNQNIPIFSGINTLRVTATNATGFGSASVSVDCRRPLPDIHAQITWDRDGTDVDLHLIRPGGQMWTNDDCYFSNRNPDWGVQGDPTDDPSLDVDDIDGFGPENIILWRPEEGAYQVIIHYYSDHGQGPTSVMVRLWIQGRPYTFGPQQMGNHDTWCVAAIHWPSMNVTDCGAPDATVTLTPTATLTPTITSTPTETAVPPTPTSTPSPVWTDSPGRQDTATPTYTPSVTRTPSQTPSQTPSSTPTLTPTLTPTATATPTHPRYHAWLPVIIRAVPPPTATPTLSPTPVSCDPPAEPNDSPDDACGPLASGGTYHGSLSAEDPDDWFFVNLDEPVVLTIDLTEVPANTDFDLYLYRTGDYRDRGVAWSERGPGQSEHLEYAVPEAGRYEIRIYQRTGPDVRQGYALTVRW